MSTSLHTWKRLSLIQIGGLISSPILLVGYTLGLHYSFLVSMLIILGGNLCLYLIAYYYAGFFASYRLTTIELAQHLLGPRGGKIGAITLFVTMTGWAALQVQILTSALIPYFPHYQTLMVILLISIPCVLCRNNLKLIGQFNFVILPFLISLLFYTLFNIAHTPYEAAPVFIPIKTSLLLIICTALGMVFDLPTFYKDSVSLRDTRISLTLLFAVFLPCIEVIGCLFSFLNGHTLLNDDLPFLLQLNSSNVFILAFILGGIASNSINIFSSSMIMHKATKLFNFDQSICLSFLATLFLYFVLTKLNFISYLEIINTSIIIMGAIFIIFAIQNKSNLHICPSIQQKNEIIFYFSLIASAFLYIFNFNISGNVLIDTILLTCLTFIIYPQGKPYVN